MHHSDTLKAMQDVLPPLEVEDRIIMHKQPPEARHCFDELVAANPDLRIELQGDGTIIVMATAGGESDYQSNEVSAQLSSWAKADGRGKAFGATLGCNLPDGSTLSPDAAWIPNEMLNALPKAVRKTYFPLVPPFLVEVKSPSDSVRELTGKMPPVDCERRRTCLVDLWREADSLGVLRFHGTAIGKRRNLKRKRSSTRVCTGPSAYLGRAVIRGNNDFSSVDDTGQVS